MSEQVRQRKGSNSKGMSQVERETKKWVEVQRNQRNVEVEKPELCSQETEGHVSGDNDVSEGSGAVGQGSG